MLKSHLWIRNSSGIFTLLPKAYNLFGRFKLIIKQKFFKTVLNENIKAFIIYITSFNIRIKIIIYFTLEAQITL